MKIPKRLTLLGQTITVEIKDDLYHLQEVHGLAVYRENKILLQGSNDGITLTDESIEHNFMHELVHFVLYFAGEDSFDPPIHKREYLVDRIAGLLHQALKTAEFA